MADAFVRVPPDSTGKLVDTSELTVNSTTVERQRINIADPAVASGLATVSSSYGLSVSLASTSNPVSVIGTASVVSASSGLVQISGTPTVTATAGTNPWSSAPGFNVPVVTVSSGLVQISGVPSFIISSSAGLATITVVSASSGLVQISGSPTVVAASSGLVQISGTATIVSASSGFIQILPQSSGAMTIFSYVTSSSTNSNNVQSGGTAFFGYSIFNTTAAQRFVKLYQTSSAPTVGSTANFLMTLGIPGSTGGGGANLISPIPMAYSTRGLGFTITASPNTTDTGTIGNNDLVVNLMII